MPVLNLYSLERGNGYRRNGLKWFSGEYKPGQIIVPGEIVLYCTDLTKEKGFLVITCRCRSGVSTALTGSGWAGPNMRR